MLTSYCTFTRSLFMSLLIFILSNKKNTFWIHVKNLIKGYDKPKV